MKPRDLFDLHIMREPLQISDEAIVERFLANYQPNGWTDAVGRRIADSHLSNEFMEAVKTEISNGFLPRTFQVGEASSVYAHLAERVAAARSRHASNPGAPQLDAGITVEPSMSSSLPAARCGFKGPISKRNCVGPVGHNGAHRYQ